MCASILEGNKAFGCTLFAQSYKLFPVSFVGAPWQKLPSTGTSAASASTQSKYMLICVSGCVCTTLTHNSLHQKSPPSISNSGHNVPCAPSGRASPLENCCGDRGALQEGQQAKGAKHTFPSYSPSNLLLSPVGPSLAAFSSLDKQLDPA